VTSEEIRRREMDADSEADAGQDAGLNAVTQLSKDDREIVRIILAGDDAAAT